MQEYLVGIIVAVAGAYALMWVLDRLAERVTEKAFLGIIIVALTTIMAIIAV